jgi:hypothetical protein
MIALVAVGAVVIGIALLVLRTWITAISGLPRGACAGLAVSIIVIGALGTSAWMMGGLVMSPPPSSGGHPLIDRPTSPQSSGEQPLIGHPTSLLGPASPKAERTSPPPARPPPATGTLVLQVSPPGAVLSIDGKRVGPAAGLRQEVLAGTHELTISAAGFESLRETVIVPAGGEKNLGVALAGVPPPPSPGALITEHAKMQVVGQALRQLPLGKIYLEAPMNMRVGDKQSVAARVGIGVSADVLRGTARVGQQTTSGALRVSHQMIATLTGPGFAITPTTPEEQTIAEGFPTVWEWMIEAKQQGNQELEATLYALVPDPVSQTARQRIDSYSRTINVAVRELTWGEWLKSIRDEIDAVKAIVISLGAIATAVAGWLGILATRRRRRPGNAARTEQVRRRA